MVSNRRLWIALVAAAALAACSGPKKSTKNDSTNPPAGGGGDLWSMTPANAAAGFVVEDGALLTLHAAAAEAMRIAEGHPMTKAGADDFRRELSAAPFDPTIPADYAKVGVDLSKGLAVWADATDRIYAVLPVVDPAKFVAAVGGHTTNEAGLEVDVFEDDMRCAMKAGRYVCAQTAAAIAEVGAGAPGPLAQQAMASTVGGQIRMVVDPTRYPIAARLPGLDRYLTNVGALAVGATFEPGGVSIEAHLPGKLVGEGQKMAAAPSLLAGKAAGERPSGAMHARIDPSLFAMGDGPELPMGIKISDILSTLTGEMIALSHAGTSASVALQVGLTSSKAVRQLVEMGCTMASGFDSSVKLRWNNGKCSGEISFAGAPAEVRRMTRLKKIDVDITVSDNMLDVRLALGERGPVSNAPSPSDHGADMIAGNWNLSAWGEGLSPIYLLDVINLNAMPVEEREGAKAGLWILGHLYEAGMGIGFRDDGIHGVMRIKTFAAAPAEEYKAYEAALSRAVSGDWKGAKADLDALAQKNPGGMVARQVGLKSGAWLGVMGMAGAAVPWFVLTGDSFEAPPPPVVAP